MSKSYSDLRKMTKDELINIMVSRNETRFSDRIC